MRGKIGLVLIALSIMFCGITLFLPQALAPFGQTLCTNEETYQGELTGSGNLARGRVNPMYSCVNEQGIPRNINDQVLPMATVILLVLCLGGVFLAREYLEQLAQRKTRKGK